MNMRTSAELSSITIYPELVRKFMCNLPNKFTRSPDDIPSAVLRSLSYELCTPLYIIFKASIDSYSKIWYNWQYLKMVCELLK